MLDIEGAEHIETTEQLLEFLRERALERSTKRKGYVGLTTRQLVAATGMPLLDVENALDTLREAALIDYGISKIDKAPMRIRVTGARHQSAVDRWRQSLVEDALDDPVEGAPDGHPDDAYVGEPDSVVAGLPDIPVIDPFYIDGLPVIKALMQRGNATRVAAGLLETVGLEQLAGEVRLASQEMTRLEREVLELLGRIVANDE